MAQSELKLANAALTYIGAQMISVVDTTTKQGKIISDRIEQVRQSFLRMHPWNFASDRDVLTAETLDITNVVDNGSGLIRVFVTAHGLSTDDWIMVQGVLGTSADGRWKVTVITSGSFDLQDSEHDGGTYTSGGEIWDTPPFDFTYIHALPSTCIRVVEINEGDENYRIEGRNILIDAEEVRIKFVKDVTDYTQFDPMTFDALALYLAISICDALSQSEQDKASLVEQFTKLNLPRARMVDSVEEPARTLRADTWDDDRIGLSSFVRDPMT